MEKIKGKIVYKDEQTNYINGAFGSINQNGDFVINLYFEQPANSTQFTIDFNGSNIPVQTFDDNGIIKTVMSKVVLNVSTAKSIAEWIKNNVSEYEKNMESNKSI